MITIISEIATNIDNFPTPMFMQLGLIFLLVIMCPPGRINMFESHMPPIYLKPALVQVIHTAVKTNKSPFNTKLNINAS